jgi:hypothetical protein
MGWGIDQQITNINLLKVGIFASYVGNSAGLYKCPADNYLSAAQRAPGIQRAPAAFP